LVAPFIQLDGTTRLVVVDKERSSQVAPFIQLDGTTRLAVVDKSSFVSIAVFLQTRKFFCTMQIVKRNVE
jgi:hypothetical protein